mmetsp:Transcript_7454/g.14669  ORF Transcript_7454/g.14669 Transcript_7454/m.14669 type:complete len:192 (-) Transcript_7454:418-993(-)
MASLLDEGFCSRLQVDSSSLMINTYLVLASPHILYAFIWFNSKTFMSIFGKKCVKKFAFIASLLKVFQFSMVTLYVWSIRNEGLCFDFSKLNFFTFVIGVIIGAFGQALNSGVYRSLGIEGVYYGFKLGCKIPWVEGYPFNVVSHPQYVGSVLSIWAAFLIFSTQLPTAVLTLAIYWTSLYFITGVIEQYF